jgi:hypothetical protein
MKLLLFLPITDDPENRCDFKSLKTAGIVSTLPRAADSTEEVPEEYRLV